MNLEELVNGLRFCPICGSAPMARRAGDKHFLVCPCCRWQTHPYTEEDKECITDQWSDTCQQLERVLEKKRATEVIKVRRNRRLQINVRDDLEALDNVARQLCGIWSDIKDMHAEMAQRFEKRKDTCQNCRYDGTDRCKYCARSYMDEWTINTSRK